MPYLKTGSGMCSELAATAEANREVVEPLFAKEIEQAQRGIDILFEIAAQHVFTFERLVARTEAERAAYQLLQKQGHAQFDALSLLRTGSFGSARVILRQVLEALLIGKFCCVSEDESLALKWLNGDTVYIGREVIGRIETPAVEPIEQFWTTLCNFSHATIYAQQGSRTLEDDVEIGEVEVTFVLLQMLIESAYHLLNTHILRSDIRYYASYYVDNFDAPRLRIEARDLFKESRKPWGPAARAYARCYKATWRLKEVPAHRLVRTPQSFNPNLLPEHRRVTGKGRG